MSKTEGLKAVVVGGTGAVGREIVGQLLCSPRWDQVTTVGRRPVEVPASYTGWDAGMLKQVVVNMDRLEEEAGQAFRGADAAFCALGTTRGAAGSAEAFRKVDLHYVEATARAAKAASVPFFGLVSAQGAHANVWSSDLKPFHGLLYMKCKGLAEEAVKAQGFPLGASIMRPGLLDRGDMARGGERVFAKLPLISSVKTRDVAKVLIADAERHLASGSSDVKVCEMKDILQAAKA